MTPSEFDIDLGDGHWLKFAEYGGERSGARVIHSTDKTESGMCDGWITFARSPWAKAFTDGSIPVWTIEMTDPLTLSPSILCRTCGDHGFIRNGRWVRA